MFIFLTPQITFHNFTFQAFFTFFSFLHNVIKIVILSLYFLVVRKHLFIFSLTIFHPGLFPWHIFFFSWLIGPILGRTKDIKVNMYRKLPFSSKLPFLSCFIIILVSYLVVCSKSLFTVYAKLGQIYIWRPLKFFFTCTPPIPVPSVFSWPELLWQEFIRIYTF